MNLRDFQLSSRAVIPLALAIPIAREPLDLRVQQERERRRRAGNGEQNEAGEVSFHL